ncbi:hypothetical protein GIB67_038293 [Kingdonia uniflora]|uniref:Uncharacterized protein n=1 Tax=Kingdonia uniflora TaxID=39325 RepID=A0A7J7KUK9_9MAGN|nr:hypothetical protein GIB67_038293 [Kingdonia uniflora]
MLFRCLIEFREFLINQHKVKMILFPVFRLFLIRVSTPPVFFKREVRFSILFVC